MAITGRGNRRHLRNHAHCREHAILWIAHVELGVVEGRQGTDHTCHHGHGVGIIVEAGDEGVQLLMHHGVVGDLVLELRELILRRQCDCECR